MFKGHSVILGFTAAFSLSPSTCVRHRTFVAVQSRRRTLGAVARRCRTFAQSRVSLTGKLSSLLVAGHRSSPLVAAGPRHFSGFWIFYGWV